MAKKSISIKWFPPSWFQIKYKDTIIYIDPAWMRTLFTNYPKKVEFSKWPDPIDGLPEKDLEKADVILITHHHKDHCKRVTVNRLKKLGKIDVAMLPIGGTFTMDVDEAVEAALVIKPKIVIPMHFKEKERPIYDSFRSVFECFKV